MQYRPQSAQDQYDEQMEEMDFKPKPLPNPNPYSSLPIAPIRAQFNSQEEYEEARGYWQGHVGRIKGMIDKAQRSKDSQQE